MHMQHQTEHLINGGGNQMFQMFISVVNHVSLIGYQLTWKTLNMVDRLSLSDTDEKPKVMPRSRMMSQGGDQNILFKGLTIGPK